MRILAIEKELPGKTEADFPNHSKAEAHQVWKLIQEEKIREIYFRRDQDSAVILLECQDLKEAVNILDTLPLVKNNLIQFELIPLRPYPGLERLFGE